VPVRAVLKFIAVNARPRLVPLRTAAWIALFAILLAALAPPVSKLVRTFKGDPLAFAELCSTARPGTAAVPAGKTPGGPMLSMERCPFCTTHGDAPGLPPAPLAVMPVPHAVHAVPRLFLRAPRPLHAWAPYQPRGPPVLS